MTLEELQVRFTADIAPLSERLSALEDMLSAAGARADALADAFRTAGERAGEGLAGGVASRKGMVAAAARDVALTEADARADMLADAFRTAGERAGEGLAGGVASRKGMVAAAARDVALAAAEALRGALAIHSPSKVTFDSGTRFTEGFTKGVEGGAPRVRRAVETLGSTAASALAPLATPVPAKPAWSDARPQDPLSLTIPLYIDGYKLGVAAIDGINRVSRSTGGVELTL